MSKEKISGIYCIENLANGKKYIGLSKNIHKRLSDHKYRLRTHRTNENRYLQRAWDKYGDSSFIFYILEECDESEFSVKEQFYIKKYNTSNPQYGYNATLGGETGNIMTKRAKELNSLIQTRKSVIQFDLNGNVLNKYRNSTVAAKSNNLSKGNIHGCCLRRYGRKTYANSIWMFEDDYDKNGIDLTMYKRNDSSKSIIQYDLFGNSIATYNSAREAEIITGISHKQISQGCNGYKKIVHGYVWRFLKDPFNKHEIEFIKDVNLA